MTERGTFLRRDGGSDRLPRCQNARKARLTERSEGSLARRRLTPFFLRINCPRKPTICPILCTERASWPAETGTSCAIDMFEVGARFMFL